MPALKKRRSSTSDKPNDIGEGHKKSKLIESCDIYTRSHLSHLMVENPVFGVEKKIDKKIENLSEPILANGKNSKLNQVNFLYHKALPLV